MSTSPDVSPLQRTRSGTVCAVFPSPGCVLSAVLTWTWVIILLLALEAPVPQRSAQCGVAVVLSPVLCGVGWNCFIKLTGCCFGLLSFTKVGGMFVSQLDFAAAEISLNLEFHVQPSLSSVNLLPVRRKIQDWTEEHKPSHLLKSLTVEQF